MKIAMSTFLFLGNRHQTSFSPKSKKTNLLQLIHDLGKHLPGSSVEKTSYPGICSHSMVYLLSLKRANAFGRFTQSTTHSIRFPKNAARVRLPSSLMTLCLNSTIVPSGAFTSAMCLTPPFSCTCSCMSPKRSFQSRCHCVSSSFQGSQSITDLCAQCGNRISPHRANTGCLHIGQIAPTSPFSGHTRNPFRIANFTRPPLLSSVTRAPLATSRPSAHGHIPALLHRWHLPKLRALLLLHRRKPSCLDESHFVPFRYCVNGSVWYYIARRLDKAVIFGVERLPRIGV